MVADPPREHGTKTSDERMVAAMREGAARLNGIIQSAMDAIITVDERQDIVIFNPAAEEMFGCTAADVLGTPLEQFIPSRFRQAHATYIDRFGATGVTRRLMGAQSEIVGLRANGEEFPLEASISQLLSGGKKLFTVILRDITWRKHDELALRESAERYQRLVELVPDAIWIEREERIAFANRACVQLLGADSVVQVLGRSPMQFIHVDFHLLAAERRKILGKGVEAVPRVEKRIVRLDGAVRDVEIAEAPFSDEGVTAIFAVLRDITERKRSENAMVESREQLSRLSASLQTVREEEKARIARELHDELGQSLTGLKMDVADILTQLRPDQAHAIARAGAMKSLIETTVASVRRIATELRPLMLDDLGLVPTVEWLTHDFSRRTGIDVALQVPDSDFHAARDLATAIFRVLQESLTNVVRHAGASHVDVTLSATDNDVQLRVRDNGKGIDAAAVGGVHTLGLLGMRERARILGGELIVDSVPGGGTTITLIVPCQPGGGL
jgi:two-component system sensor histidine kinase UhpB